MGKKETLMIVFVFFICHKVSNIFKYFKIKCSQHYQIRQKKMSSTRLISANIVPLMTVRT